MSTEQVPQKMTKGLPNLLDRLVLTACKMLGTEDIKKLEEKLNKFTSLRLDGNIDEDTMLAEQIRTTCLALKEARR